MVREVDCFVFEKISFVFQFTTKPNIGWVGGFAPLSGVLLCVILAVMVICSMQWIRRGGYFQVKHPNTLNRLISILILDFLLDSSSVLRVFHFVDSSRSELLGLFSKCLIVKSTMFISFLLK